MVEQDDSLTEMNWFIGGPHDNELLTVEQLLYDRPVKTWISQYAWTSETVVGSESGKLARVWRYKG